MYAHIRGTVEEKGIDRAVIEAAGVGYELLCSEATLRQLGVGNQAKLLVHFHISQDNVALYGFYTSEERAMFRKLIGVTRVGPKLALAVLGKLSVLDIATAILTENAAAFDRVPGMGRKTAARVLLELKEKVSGDEMLSAGVVPGTGLDMRGEAIAALLALGYDGVTAGRAVNSVEECTKVEEIITRALREIGKRNSL